LILIGETNLKEKIKDALFKISIFFLIEIICLNLFLIISGITGSFEWSVERLTSSIAGMIIQVINLISLICGIIIVIYIIIAIILLIKS